MKTLQSAPWKFRWQPGLCCYPKDKNFWTITCLEFPSLPTNREHLKPEKYSPVLEHKIPTPGIRAIRFRRHWIRLGRSCSGYGQCLSTWNWYPIFSIHLWRFSDGGIDRCQPNNSWRWGRQGEISSNNINTRVWASNGASQITEKSSIWNLTGKCAWIRIQDSVSLNFVFDTLYVFCVHK